VNFEDFIKKGVVRKTSKDLQLVKSIIKTADNDLKFLGNLTIDKVSSRKIFSNYYDVLRSILEAMALLENYKVYSHEAFTYFLKEKNKEVLANKFDRFRKIRNKINYYAADISIEEVTEYKNELISMINKLKEKIQ